MRRGLPGPSRLIDEEGLRCDGLKMEPRLRWILTWKTRSFFKVCDAVHLTTANLIPEFPLDVHSRGLKVSFKLCVCVFFNRVVIKL
ncbi:hypothetical protein scyTo_0001995 [Scyliorhinus torazame]|uniref:Uncharacterized protein n=1 Tax=Scyliorhinus torazame TaxID=75743 RepID=A0A401PH67_SCYTO|nr:hypothetical protein [Scyliorhinus torazame]